MMQFDVICPEREFRHLPNMARELLYLGLPLDEIRLL